MSATATVKMQIETRGLGMDIIKSDNFSMTTPTAATYQYRTLATANTDEALDLGDVSTVDGVWIRAIDYALSVDTSYSASFNAEISIPAGRSAYFKPSGTVRVKNATADQTPSFEYCIIGQT